MAGKDDSRNDIFEDESSRLKDGLRSCHNLLANYRTMLSESSNDNSIDDVAKDDSEVG